MSETIKKLQPHRTMQLRGFDGYGATATFWGASDNGWKLSGVWGEQSDFVVLELWNADNAFEHARLRYLPDVKFDGMVLEFDFHADNCMAIDSNDFASVDWATLNVLYADGTQQKIPLKDCATPIDALGNEYVQASAMFSLEGSVTAGDWVELAWGDDHVNYCFQPGDILGNATLAMCDAVNAFSTTMTATRDGAQITLTAKLAQGANGNKLGVYGSIKGVGTESWTPAWQVLSGGTSPTYWHLTFDFSDTEKFRSDQIQQMWLTFAPPIGRGPHGFEGGEFAVEATNWTVTDANGRRALKVAAPGSVRIEENDKWVERTGYWESADAVGFWSQGRAIRSAYSEYETRTLKVQTHCQSGHSIYVGTRIDWNCGKIQATLDGGDPVTLDCYGTANQVRRLLFSGVSEGHHEVEITLLADKNANSGGWYFYFDFLECAVLGNVPDATATITTVGAATDFDTDATYKLSPQRLLWSIRKLGLLGDIDHYAGVFWWPVRKPLAEASTWEQHTAITFSGNPEFGKRVTLTLGGYPTAHMCWYTDTPNSVVKALELLINERSAALRAIYNGTTLDIYSRAPGPDFHLDVEVSSESDLFTAEVATTNRSPATLEWGVDDSADHAINKPVRDWHSDFFNEVHGAGMSATVAFSMELVNPPEAYAQRFANGMPVETDTGFGGLKSTQCTFTPTVQAFQKRAFEEMAGLMSAKSLTPWLQFGEFLWWFFPGSNPSDTKGMAFYDTETATAAHDALGRDLATFSHPTDTPDVHGYADANFLRQRIYDHCSGIMSYVRAAHGGTKFELLWPYDVNHPTRTAITLLGGQLNRYVNMPSQFQAKTDSGLDRLKMEGLAFGASERNLTQATEAMRFPRTSPMAWGKEDTAYILPWFNGGCPWTLEYLATIAAGVPVVNMWAFDHLNLFSWPLPLPKPLSTARSL